MRLAHLLILATAASTTHLTSQAQSPNQSIDNGEQVAAAPVGISLSMVTPLTVPATVEAGAPEAAIVKAPARSKVPSPGMRFGGIHEFGVSVGVSRVSGAVWGYRQDVDYEVINLRYARVIKNGRRITASYSPEITPYARLDEPVLDQNDKEIARTHTTGGGITPIGFTVDFRPRHSIQPFWRCNAGMLYFRNRVLSPEGSQFMYTIDFGGGVHLYESRYVSTSIGFRYNHLSNANISIHNPGTDAETFYVAFSRFHSPKNREAE